MRKALNENPMVQIAVLAVLAIGVGLLLLIRMGGGSSAPGTDTTAAPTDASVSPLPAAADAAAPVAPASPVPASSGAVSPTPATGAASPGFVAGPGLPKPVASAYDDGKAVVLLIVRRQGIDDEAVRNGVEALRSRDDIAVFVTGAGEISRYSRITEGVNVNRVPALVVIKPREPSAGLPLASVSYGFRGTGSIVQAVEDALYKGGELPYYPK